MTNITRYTTILDVDLSNLLELAGCVGSSKKWYIGSTGNYVGSGKHVALPVEAGQKYTIKSSISTVDKAWCAYLTDAYNPPYTGGSSTPHVSGYDRFSITTTTTIITIPEGCAYLAISIQDGEYNNISWTLLQHATETAPYTINGVKCFLVTDVWDGEIDAGGIHIDDAFDLNTVQITDNDSEELLSLLTQICNIKSLKRMLRPEFSVVSEGCQVTNIDRFVGNTHVTKCYKCLALWYVYSYKMRGHLYEGEITTIQLTPQQIIDNIDMLPEIDLLTADTVPIPYNDYAYYLDNNLPLAESAPMEKLFYKDQNGVTQFIEDEHKRFRAYIITYSDLLNEGILLTYYNYLDPELAFFYQYGNVYSKLEYAESPGKSMIVTDLIPTEKSKFSATILYTAAYAGQNVRAITAGRDNYRPSYSTSYESGALKVSYSNKTSWTSYNILKDVNKHTYTFDRDSFYLDDNLLGSGGNTDSFTCEAPFAILGEANMTTFLVWAASAKIYGAEFYENDVLISKLVPAVKLSNGEVGLVDVLRNLFFTSNNLPFTSPT